MVVYGSRCRGVVFLWVRSMGKLGFIFVRVMYVHLSLYNTSAYPQKCRSAFAKQWCQCVAWDSVK